jgi:hypothetical protein
MRVAPVKVINTQNDRRPSRGAAGNQSHVKSYCIMRPESLVFGPYSHFSDRGEIAQLVEQRIENPRVGGSIPSLATILRSER